MSKIVIAVATVVSLKNKKSNSTFPDLYTKEMHKSLKASPQLFCLNLRSTHIAYYICVLCTDVAKYN